MFGFGQYGQHGVHYTQAGFPSITDYRLGPKPGCVLQLPMMSKTSEACCPARYARYPPELGMGVPMGWGRLGWAAGLTVGAEGVAARCGVGFASFFLFFPVLGCVFGVLGGGIRRVRPGCRCRWVLRRTSLVCGGVGWSGWGGRSGRIPGPALRPLAVARRCLIFCCVPATASGLCPRR